MIGFLCSLVFLWLLMAAAATVCSVVINRALPFVADVLFGKER